MQPQFELLDHTADLGVRVTAPSLAELVRVAGEGLYTVIGNLQPTAGNPRPEHFEFVAADQAVLLRDYLAELLLVFERDLRMMTAVQVETFDAERLVVSGQSRPVDREHSAFDREVKAITYHGLRLHPTKGGYEAEFIVDI